MSEKKPPLKELQKELDRVLGLPLPDSALLVELETLAKDNRFGALFWRFGPLLYRRNKTHFRPFILAHFLTHYWDPPKWVTVTFGEHAKELEPWLKEVDESDDIELFTRLYGLKIGGKFDGLQAELLKQLSRAVTPDARRTVIQKFSGFWFTLSEEAALEIYRMEPSAREFLIHHSPTPWIFQRKPTQWTKLMALAQESKDEALYFDLYRRQIDPKAWEAEALKLVERGGLGLEALIKALDQRQPLIRPKMGRLLGAIFERYGREALPYLRRHLMGVSREGGDGKKYLQAMLALAEKNGWEEAWALLLLHGGSSQEIDETIRGLLKNTSLESSLVEARLALLGGARGEFNFGRFGMAAVHALSDETAALFYQRFPRLLSSRYKANLGYMWTGYPKLIEAVIAARDDTLLDHIASRAATRPLTHAPKPIQEQIDLLSHYYEGLRGSPNEFAWRASQVLTQIPAYTIYHFDNLLKTNRLARLLFERSRQTYLAVPAGVRDLLEAAEIHVQALGFSVLAQERPEAAALAKDNLDLLIPTLLRPLHRRTRILALRALARAGEGLTEAQRILPKAKDAWALPDRKYPKEELLSLIAALLHRHPSLRSEPEAPKVWRLLEARP